MKRITGITLAILLLLAGCGGSEGGLGNGPGNEPGGEDEPKDKPESPPDGAIFIETQGAVWSAYREGDGAWRVLQNAKARHTISVENAGGRFAVAHVCLDEAETVTAALLYATVAARPEVLSPCTSQGEDDPETFYTLAGTLNGLAAGETGRVHGAAQTSVADGSDNTYSLAGLTEGTYDLLVSVYTDTSAPPSEVLLSEEVSVTGDRTLDLALEEAAPTTLKTLTVEGASGDEVSSSVTLVTERNTRAELGTLAATSDAEDALSYDYAALPSVPEGTRYYLFVESVSDRQADGGDLLTRSLERTLAGPADLSLRLPPALEASAELTGGRPQITWRSYAADTKVVSKVADKVDSGDVTADYRVTFESLSEDETRYVASLTGAWLEDSAYTLPDFGDLPGWDDAWNLPSELFWSLSAQLEREGERVSSSRSGRVDTD